MDIFLNQLLKEMDEVFKPDPDENLKSNLKNRLGDFDSKGYYRSTQLIVYLRITSSTYQRLVCQQFGLKLDKIHYKQAAQILVFIEGTITLQDRQLEEQKYLNALF